MRTAVTILLAFLSFFSVAQLALSDQKATKKTTYLYQFLDQHSHGNTLFGHQDDLSYGLGWWAEKGESDVKRISGKYPAVFGWDIGEIGSERNLDSVSFDHMLTSIKRVYRMGGINTISWHMINPLTGGNSWEVTSTVKAILPGGKAHDAYLKKLDLFARFVKKCRIGLNKIPLVFRPFHEHNGGWFWWGIESSNEQDYIDLWRFTVDYLRNEKKIHHLIYVFSPDRSGMDMSKPEDSYLYGYPGDAYVDVIGLDNYWDLGHTANPQSLQQQAADLHHSLAVISKIASNRGKVAALTETGNDGVKPANWYTEALLKPIKASNSNIAWVMVWRNANKGHFYVPYDGHHNDEDFKSFEKDQVTTFLSDFNNPYRKPR